MSERTELDFSYNWNNKLDYLAFTTLRRHNPGKYSTGKILTVSLKKDFKCTAEIVGIRTIPLEKINDFIAYLDTGYSLVECNAIIRKMYPDATNSTLFDLVLLKRKK